MPHLCCPITSQAVPYLPYFLHPTSLPHVLSEGRWIALLCDINNMSYCWSVKGKACELSILSHWLHDWDDVPHFFSFFLSLNLSLALDLSLSFLSYSLPLEKASPCSSPLSLSCPCGIKTHWRRLSLPMYSKHRKVFSEKIKAFLGH